MKVLLDTHIAIWIAGGASNASEKIRNIADDAENTLYISAAVLWEIAIKHGKGQLALHPLEARSSFHQTGMIELPITADHTLALTSLPQYPDHADPFDRIMIAQALYEAMPLLTADEKLWRYHATLVIPA
ncbi:type II toxin-antitoxin system VapC family toxin [Phyllobacterium zundukense]|uniref:Twitching motility protein PilT n=1 Tax=Phyllobacterium zundukense TaxID=1867719 RepID=A0A2N9VQ76_9HYPH|nr:type II toxin-antitoxin system VapC family toxin [Phyllobacterium zundukense]ATU90749.1 twitching motility protein PilT [Phyllobacterium zundukense]PIO41644.1 twitching motility protein PilT [Phyllobacterium zundukense]